MRKLWITGCIVMICMGMLTACGGNKMEVVPIGDTEEADREVPSCGRRKGIGYDLKLYG